MELPIYQVDTFASKVFAGSPAAVMSLDKWLDDIVLHAASEHCVIATAPGDECDFVSTKVSTFDFYDDIVANAAGIQGSYGAPRTYGVDLTFNC
jgi:hypothetical protein